MNKIRFIFLSVFLFSLAACTTSPESVPNAWIDYPRDGHLFSSGETVNIRSHLFAKDGVSEVVLSVNGEPYRRDVPVDAGQDFVSMEQVWIAGEVGIYSISVQVYGQQGQVGNPAVISVSVIDGVAPEFPTAVATETPVPTDVPTNKPTQVPSLVPTSTFTPVPYIPTDTPTSLPADASPPPVPNPAVPASGLELSCRSTQILVWLPVSDSSGITGYYVKLEREASPGNWQSVGGYGPLNDKQVNVQVDCGIRYRWMVRAQDGAGNYSSWSAPSTFSVSLN